LSHFSHSLGREKIQRKKEWRDWAMMDDEQNRKSEVVKIEYRSDREL